MISFKAYIEESSKHFSLEQFLKDCSFYLEQVKDSDSKMIYHGSTARIPHDWAIQQWRPRTGPRDSKAQAHAAFNEFFSKKFGVEARNWLFTTPHLNTAHLYGEVMAIFPIGNFEWIFSPDPNFQDLTGTVDYKRYQVKNSAAALTYDEVYELALSNTLKDMEAGVWYHNEKLKRGLSGTNEIMIKCDKFYAIRVGTDTFKVVNSVIGHKSQ